MGLHFRFARISSSPYCFHSFMIPVWLSFDLATLDFNSDQRTKESALKKTSLRALQGV